MSMKGLTVHAPSQLSADLEKVLSRVFLSCTKMSDKCCSAGENFFRLIFDRQCFGFRAIAAKIVMQLLDYHSFVNLKRSAKFLHEYLSDIEETKLAQKLNSDWREGHVRNCKFRHDRNVQVSASKLFFSDRKLACAVDADLFVYNVEVNEMESRLQGHMTMINCLAVDEAQNVLVSGDFDGVLIVWDLINEAIVTRKVRLTSLNVI